MIAPTSVPPDYGPWNPGIDSQVPKDLLYLSTIFRADNVFTTVATAAELRGLTGFALSDLVVFRPQRLALHEVLIRVTADFAVPDGSRIEDLGINFREIAGLLFGRHLMPHMESIVALYARVRGALTEAIETSLDAVVLAMTPPPIPAARHPGAGLFARMTSGRRSLAIPSTDRGWGPGQIAEFERRASSTSDPLQAIGCRTLARVMSGLFATQGQAWGTRDLIVSLSTGIACNAYGSEAIGQMIAPLLSAAAEREGYRQLPKQERPVVINTKGASASGKSTLRPLIKKLAGDIGLNWRDFALISPDIWRKQLLDYGALGATYKYAAAFTAEEVQIIDHKLDRYMARKHQRGDMSHLLIDRFRFDSFAPDSNEAGSNLLTRFGQTVYLFFVITPPAMLVDRAWKRGLEFGRYKAVDDTLAHAVEAYTGIPDLFFTWARRGDKRIRFEFLDNTVPLGERPRTVAFGDNTTLNILDVENMLNIERFARIDVDAKAAESLYRDTASLKAERNTIFLKRCLGEFRTVNFVEYATGRIYLHLESGVALWTDAVTLRSVLADPDTSAGVLAVVPAELLSKVPNTERPRYLCSPEDGLQVPTLGRWGAQMPNPERQSKNSQ